MIKKVILVVVVVIAVFAIAYFYQKNRENTVADTVVIPPVTEKTQNADPKAVSDLKQGGSSFSDPHNIFSILYPGEYIQDTQGENQYRFYKQGPTQKGQTEMYDGVIINIETIDLGGKSLSEWVDNRISTSTQDGTSEVVEGKTATKVNGYPGFSYSLRGLGVFETLVVQKDVKSNFAIGITSLIADPGNLGFEKEFTNILSTLTILK